MLLLVTVTSTAEAVNYMGTQIREIQAAIAPGSSVSDATNDSGGPWAASVAAAGSEPLIGNGISASASQISDLAPSEITMTGELSATAFSPPENEALASGISFMHRFTVDNDTPFNSMLALVGDTTVSRSSSFLVDGVPPYGANSSGVLTPDPPIPSASTCEHSPVPVWLAALAPPGVLYSYRLDFVPEPSSGCLILGGALCSRLCRHGATAVGEPAEGDGLS